MRLVSSKRVQKGGGAGMRFSFKIAKRPRVLQMNVQSRLWSAADGPRRLEGR